MISYHNIARVRREVENILLLVDELENKGIPKAVIVDIILNVSQEPNQEDEHPSKNK